MNDGACERVRVSNDIGNNLKPCPSFEQITVIRQRRRRYNLPHMGLDKLPEPTTHHAMEKPGSVWRCHMAGVGGMGIGVVNAILVRAGHKEGYRVIFADKKGLAIRNGGVYSQITFVRDGDDSSGFGAQGSVNQNTESARVAAGPTGRLPRDATTHNRENSASPSSLNPKPRTLNPNSYPTTGTIPFGRADLLLGVDILEAARAIDPRDQFRVASPQRTAAVLNTHKQPTVYTLLGKQDFDPEALREEIFAHCNAESSFAINLSELCERRLGSKLYANIMMLGVAFQLGLIPVSPRSIGWAIKDSIRREHRKNLKAFNIGRKLALEPRALPRKPEPETWEQLVTNKIRILRKSSLVGRSTAMKFDRLVQGAMKQMRDLPAAAKYDLALRIYDVLQYQDYATAKRYLDLIRGVYRRDKAERNFSATIAVIWNLAKVMLIKDEPYVSYLLTRYEKKQRDIAKYVIDVSNGDRIVYRHHTSPEFNIGRHRIRLQITTQDWMLHIVRHCKWWRKLPGWHHREVAFRDWYVELLHRVNLSSDDGYAQALRVFKCPEEVTGYREVRYPKQDRVRDMIESELTPQVPSPPTSKPSVLDALRAPTHA